ncbi:MAG: GPR endopeptidase [Butyrivibrio sp.]
MTEQIKIRTDLALEAKNSISEEDSAIKGIKVVQERDRENDITIIRMDVLNRSGAQTIGKPMGTYITMEVPRLSEEDDNYHREISRALAMQIKSLIVDLYSWNEKTPKILIAGLGNQSSTPDALGPNVVSNLMITRHIVEYFGYEEVEGAFAVTSGIIPGVMAQTGMESSEIIQAIIRKTKPDILLVVDALAARSVSRLNTTIQISDTGIHPGSGVGNQRAAINKKTMGIPVISIGVPTVVDAATLVYDSLKRVKNSASMSFASDFEQMYVTSKDVDAIIKRLSFTISEGINICMGLGR